MKVAFLDRDGTIVSDYTDERWSEINEPEFLDGAIEGLRKLRDHGYHLIIVTNQYLIGEGSITQKQYINFTERMLKVLAEKDIAILDIFFCPHRRNAGCRCLKPNPGMIEQALAKYPEIELESSFLAGDSASDIELANIFGLRAFSIAKDFPKMTCERVESIVEICYKL